MQYDVRNAIELKKIPKNAKIITIHTHFIDFDECDDLIILNDNIEELYIINKNKRIKYFPKEILFPAKLKVLYFNLLYNYPIIYPETLEKITGININLNNLPKNLLYLNIFLEDTTNMPNNIFDNLPNIISLSIDCSCYSEKIYLDFLPNSLVRLELTGVIADLEHLPSKLEMFYFIDSEKLDLCFINANYIYIKDVDQLTFSNIPIKKIELTNIRQLIIPEKVNIGKLKIYNCKIKESDINKLNVQNIVLDSCIIY